MFVLSMLEDTVRLPPEMLDPDDIEKVITDQLNITYSNKIIENLGMCILVHGIEDAKPAFLYAGDGGAHMRVKFRMVVFRPFEGMVIEGSIMQQDKTGIMVGLQFFDFIFIPAENMRENCSFKAESNQWVWEYAQGDLEFEVGSSIRVAVKEVSFRKKEKFTEAKKESETVSESLAELKAKMMIVGSIAQDGLGCSSWWD